MVTKNVGQLMFKNQHFPSTKHFCNRRTQEKQGRLRIFSKIIQPWPTPNFPQQTQKQAIPKAQNKKNQLLRLLLLKVNKQNGKEYLELQVKFGKSLILYNQLMKPENDSINMDDFQQPQANDRAHSPITYSDNVNSEDYISQFLSIPSLPDHDMHLDFKKTSGIPTGDFLINDEELFNSPPSDGLIKKQRIKSAFHNFQKHLVTTLRHSINLSELFEDPKTGGLEKKLWEFFLNCPKMTRSLLYLVYGGIDMEIGRSKKMAKQYGLSGILKGEPTARVLQAQKNLREETLRQAELINLQWELGYRRMRNKKDFRVYFLAFLEQLKQGNFNKRIPKDKRQKLQEEEKGRKEIKDFQGLSCNKA